MITPETRALLETLPQSAHGRALQELLTERMETLGDITTCVSWEETLGRKYALKVLKEIFGFMEEKKNKLKSPSQYT